MKKKDRNRIGPIIPKDLKLKFKTECRSANIKISDLSTALVEEWTISGKGKIDQDKLKKERIHIDLPKKIKEQFGTKCKKHNMSMTEVIALLMEEWIEEQRTKRQDRLIRKSNPLE